MNHDQFMSAFMQVLFSVMHRDENDVHTNHIMKLAALFITSYGEDGLEECIMTHPVIRTAFGKILSVSSIISMFNHPLIV